MADFGTLNFSVAFKPTSAFPLDARYYFASLTEAETAAASAVEVGSSEGTYFFGEVVVVVENDAATLYVIQPDGSLSEVGSGSSSGSELTGDGVSIVINEDGTVSILGVSEAEEGQQLRIAVGGGVEWFTPDTTTVEGLSSTIETLSDKVSALEESKADSATTLEGYGITDAMTADEIAEAIAEAVAAANHASLEVVESIPEAADAESNVLYLYKNADTGYYDIYALIGEEVVLIDDLSVDLSSYYTKTEVDQLISDAVAEINTALDSKVDAVEGKGLSTNDLTDELLAKLEGIAEGAEANLFDTVSDEFTLESATDEETSETTVTLTLAAVAMDKVTGLPEALAAKVDAEEGKGLSTNDFTDELLEKLNSISSSAAENVLEVVKANGTVLTISEKAVDIPLATATQAGLVVSSEDENMVTVTDDGTMEVASLNVNKLVQTDGDTLILDGGSAA